nr:MAG TPA: hypothetical protein [Caudoviricetes sp.]
MLNRKATHVFRFHNYDRWYVVYEASRIILLLINLYLLVNLLNVDNMPFCPLYLMLIFIDILQHMM